MKTLRLIGPCALAITLSCTSEDPGVPVDDCADELSGVWESVTEFGCPLVDPNCTYRLEVDFDGDDFMWMPIDTLYEGPYTCRDGAVEAIEKIDDTVVLTGTYDAESDTLELSGEGLEGVEAFQRKS